jgi:hypothetical protein
MASTTTLFDVPARQATEAGGVDSLESIPELLKRLQIRALYKGKRKNALTVIIPFDFPENFAVWRSSLLSTNLPVASKARAIPLFDSRP